jgi:hypothetical protein
MSDIFPTNHQELFIFAINKARSVNGEWGGWQDAYRLRSWARRYAATHQLTAPTDYDAYGIYYADDLLGADDRAELDAEGLL